MKNILTICYLFIVLFLIYTCQTKNEKPTGIDQTRFPSMDYEASIEKFKDSDKPTLLLFNGYACVNCRKFEKLLKEDVGLDKLNAKYNLINLHVDDKTKLDAPKTIIHTINNEKRILRTRGNMSSYLQIELTRSGSQPVFAIMKDSIVQKLIFYTPHAQELRDSLDL